VKAGDNGVKIDFGLSPSNLDDATKKAWPYNFGLIYSITFNKDELETSILVRNEGGEAWEFQTLMHTYLRVKVSTGIRKAEHYSKRIMLGL
jgi:glucose-6-phosphate 1-epimerase